MNIKFTTKPNMVLLIISIILFISIFLPWYSFDIGFGISTSLNGFRNGGILTFLMSLVGVALAFIEILPRYKVFATGGAGILALLGVIIAMTDLGGGVGMGFGMILGLLASMALIAVGFLEARKIKIIKTGPAEPPASPPPPPPAPPAQQ